MNSKNLISIILIFYLGVVTVICYAITMFLISHITILLMGIILGGSVVRNDASLEKWSRKKIKGGMKYG